LWKLKAAIFRGFPHTLGGVITILSALVSLLILMSQGDKLELQWSIGFEADGSSHEFRRSSWAGRDRVTAAASRFESLCDAIWPLSSVWHNAFGRFDGRSESDARLVGSKRLADRFQGVLAGLDVHSCIPSRSHVSERVSPVAMMARRRLPLSPTLPRTLATVSWDKDENAYRQKL
jgi:hypothetical protein